MPRIDRTTSLGLPLTGARATLDGALDDAELGVAPDAYEAATRPAALPARARDGGPSGGLAPLPGPLPAAGAAAAILRDAIARYDDAARAHPPTVRHRVPYPVSSDAPSPPPAVWQRLHRLLDGARAHLDASGVRSRLDETRGELVIVPDVTTALGRYARMMERTVGERVVFCPEVLWRDQSVGSHNIPARTVFLSTRAVESLAPTQTERHEWLHAFFGHHYDALGAYSITNAFIDPLPGYIFFGPSAAYRGGFSVEELACLAYDLVDEARPLGALRRRVEGSDVVGAARGSIARLLERVSWHIDVQAGSQVADKVVELAEHAQANLASTPPLSVEVRRSFKLARRALFLRETLGLDDSAPLPFTVELATHRLRQRDQTVVDVRLVDPRAGVDLTFPLFDARALAVVERCLGDLSERACLDELNGLVRRYLPARLEALASLGRAWQSARDDVRAARASCAALLDGGAGGRELGAALLALQQAIRALRDVISFGHGEVEPGSA